MRGAVVMMVAGLAAAICSTQACAGWEFAQWGMSPDELVKASRGKVAIRKAPKDYIAASGYSGYMGFMRYKNGDVVLKVEFSFKNNYGLSNVTLNFDEVDAFIALKAFEEKYGKCDFFVNHRDDSNDNSVSCKKWGQPDGGLSIFYTQLKQRTLDQGRL